MSSEELRVPQKSEKRSRAPGKGGKKAEARWKYSSP
jgi:hypothetical protein